MIVIAIGLLGFLPLRHIGDWLAGGPKPDPERFFVLAFLLLLPIGALRLLNTLSKYHVTLIPRAELPKTAADRQALAAGLTARYPGDPRSHVALAEVLQVAGAHCGERTVRL